MSAATTYYFQQFERPGNPTARARRLCCRAAESPGRSVPCWISLGRWDGSDPASYVEETQRVPGAEFTLADWDDAGNGGGQFQYRGAVLMIAAGPVVVNC